MVAAVVRKPKANIRRDAPAVRAKRNPKPGLEKGLLEQGKKVQKKNKSVDGGKLAYEFMNNNPNNSKYYHFEYGVVNSVGKVIESQNHACHAAMSGFKNVTAVWSRMPHGGDQENHAWRKAKSDPVKEITIRYLDWLLNSSPWAGVADNTDPEWAYEKGFVITRVDLPANYLVNFLIATRIPSEWSESVIRWTKLVDAGVPATMAFVLANFFGDDGKWNVCSGHHPFDLPYVDLVENFVLGKIKNPNKPYNVNPNYFPCNKVWGDCVGDYYDFLLKTYGADEKRANTRVFNVRGYDDPLPKFSFERLVEIGIKEHKRITNA